MTMNRLKFSEGGQPVYLDDLETLQANAAADTLTVAAALAQDNATFMLRPLQMTYKGDDSVAGTMVYTVSAGSAMVKGELVSWNETEVTLALLTDPVYLCVKRTETDIRTFEDGQARACGTNVEAWIGTSVSGVSEYYNVLEVPNMIGLLRKALGITDEPTWRTIDVEFRNGYTGTVAVKEMTDTYRVKVDIKSTQTTELSGYPLLFYTSERILQAFESPVTAYVESENGVNSFRLSAFDGAVTACVSLPFDDVSTAQGLPVKMIFDLPKF